MEDERNIQDIPSTPPTPPDFSNVVANINYNLPDNNTQLITAKKLRDTLTYVMSNVSTAIYTKDNDRIIDTLTSSDTNRALSAYQGKVLNSLIGQTNNNLTQLSNSYTILNNTVGGILGDIDNLVIDNLTSTYTDKALSAYQGKVLDTKIGNIGTFTASSTYGDFELSDENGNTLMRLEDGHVRTKYFNSSYFGDGFVIDNLTSTYTTKALSAYQGNVLNSYINEIGTYTAASSYGDFELSDESGNTLMRLEDGHIKTKYFDSSNITPGEGGDSYAYILTGGDDYDLAIADQNRYAIVKFYDGHIQTKNFNSADLAATDEYDMKTVMENFTYFSGSNWTISGNTATTAMTGTGSRLTCSKTTFEDTFNIDFDFVCSGTTFSFSFGKFYSLAGGLVLIEKTASENNVKFYVASDNSGSSTTLKDTFTLTKIHFVSGNSYHVRLTKRIYDYDHYTITITDNKFGISETNELNAKDPMRFWGILNFYMNSGSSLTISNFAFAYPNPEKLQLMISGHSFVEGNSLDTKNISKQKKYSRLIANLLGNKSVAISGRGGGTTGELAGGIFANEAELLGRPKYVLFNTGTNDGSDNNFITNANSLNTTCANLNITPIWMTISPDLRGGTNTHDTANAWVKSQPYFLDIQYAFYNEDGTINQSAFMSDNVHPSVETHKKIADMFYAKYSYLFTIDNI